MTFQRFSGKVALITGGSTGIGAAIADRFASEGARVAICGRRLHLLEQKAAELTEAGILLRPVRVDRREPTPEQEAEILSVVDQERKTYAAERRR